MKLLGCHIENFGTFHNYDLTFNDGLNVVMQANGWGKTTIAAFIKAMLYGFDGRRVRNVTANERLRYKPWQGGRYGGWLDFEAGGKEFRVIRTFGATGSRDKVRVVYIDTGKSAIGETGTNVGEWLFGLDANSFQKSVYMVQNGLSLSASSASLRNRLNALVNEADDVAGFDKAQAGLEERRKYYKKTGNRGAIADVSRDIAKLVKANAKADEQISELRQVGGEIENYTSAINVLDREIDSAQAELERSQATSHRVQALRKVEEKLRGRQREAQAAYNKAISEMGGRLPDEKAINEARKSILEIGRLEEHLAQTEAAIGTTVKQRGSLASKYPSGVPSKGELQEMREKLATVRTQDAMLNATAATGGEGFDRLHSAVTADPKLLERADAAIAKVDDVTRLIAEGRAATRELQIARAGWEERRRRLTALMKESEEAASAVPKGASTYYVQELRKDAQDLRSVNDEIARLELRLETCNSRLDEERVKLDSLPGGKICDDSAVEKLDSAADACSTAIDSVNNARAMRDDCAARLHASEKSAYEAKARLDGESHAAQQAKPGVPMPAVACFVAAVAAIVAGAMFGPVLFIVGAVIVVVGVVLLRGNGAKTSAGPSEEKLRASREADNEVEEARSALNVAENQLVEAQAKAREANDDLMSIVEELFPGESFDSASIAVQVPVLQERLGAWPKQAKRVEEARQQVDLVSSELELAREHADDIADKYADIEGGGYSQKAASMEARASDLERLLGADADARRRLENAIAEALSIDVTDLDETKMDAFLVALEREDPPEVEKLERKEREAHDVSHEYAAELSALLKSFGDKGVGVDEIAVGSERLSRTVSAYRAWRSRQKIAEKKQSDRMRLIALEKNRIAEWANRIGVGRIDDLSDEWFDSVEDDISAIEKLLWEEKRARTDAIAAQKSLRNLRRQVDTFFTKYGVRIQGELSPALDGLLERTNEVSNLKQALRQTDAELAQWLSENQEILESARHSMSSGGQSGMTGNLEMLRRQRDSLLREKAKQEEHRNALLQSLEGRLSVRQELELLSKRKQKATTNLFTIQKTSEYLRRAREGLDGRYLGDLADRFSDYANALLGNEEIQVTVNPDFDVEVYEGRVAHDVAGYSTGYRDLLDMCFRMALVDTVFQAESPFLILDDPFASMDAEKIGSSISLLQSLATKYQIIYFTCHPSRTEGEVANSERVAFVLPEQRARRELPRARAKRDAEERAKAQEELVASYMVVPVSRGRVSIAPTGGRHSIDSNLFCARFGVDDSLGSGDNAFEVHFIDGKGRVLCDRQSVEVIGGRIVPDKVRFSLATHDDSGDTYDMIIHEDGREPAELAARIPYKAEVSFASDDFGF